ncbi:MAG TPA: hypothetical protein VGQ93_07590 [Lysobacter sp.]|nr:hypothetical protein [Lysobacter sp.]
MKPGTWHWFALRDGQEVRPLFALLLTRQEEFEMWLKAPAGDALALAKEYPPHQMRIVRDGFEKEDLLEAA